MGTWVIWFGEGLTQNLEALPSKPEFFSHTSKKYFQIVFSPYFTSFGRPPSKFMNAVPTKPSRERRKSSQSSFPPQTLPSHHPKQLSPRTSETVSNPFSSSSTPPNQVSETNQRTFELSPHNPSPIVTSISSSSLPVFSNLSSFSSPSSPPAKSRQLSVSDSLIPDKLPSSFPESFIFHCSWGLTVYESLELEETLRGL